MHSLTGTHRSNNSEDRGEARIVTTLVLRTSKVALQRDSERIGGVDLVVNSSSLAIFAPKFRLLHFLEKDFLNFTYANG